MLDFRSVVKVGAMLQTAGPCEDGGDRIGRGLFTLLPTAIMAGHGAVRGFGFDGLPVGSHQHGGH